VKLHGYWRSSSAWRVRIALGWKGVPYTAVAVNLIRDGGEQHTPSFRDLNAIGQVPLLELDDGRRLAQSMAIIEYLEDRFPLPALLPADPWQRARARQLAEIVNAGIQPLHNLATLQHVKAALGGDPDVWVRHFVGRGLGALERAAAETAGRFLVGDELSLADVYLVPQLYVARRYGVELGPFATLTRVESACATLPAFAGAHPDVQPDAPPRAG
jgi:maleylpyruvate isomerase